MSKKEYTDPLATDLLASDIEEEDDETVELIKDMLAKGSRIRTEVLDFIEGDSTEEDYDDLLYNILKYALSIVKRLIEELDRNYTGPFQGPFRKKDANRMILDLYEILNWAKPIIG